MADNYIYKYCLDFYKNNRCVRNNCNLVHEKSDFIDLIRIYYEEGIVEGRHTNIPICRFNQRGCCKFGRNCRYRHINSCLLNLNLPSSSSNYNNQSNFTSTSSSNPTSTFATITNKLKLQSQEKVCGICFEIVLKKSNFDDQKFGILPNCTHCYCIKCISKWRQSRQFDNDVIKACPECRIQSDYICPSKLWVDKKEDKDKLISDYKLALSRRDCKYFRKGSGNCPFGNKCFYRHALPDGRICDVGPPRPRRPRRNYPDNNTNFEVLQHVVLFDLLEESNAWSMAIEDDLDELSNFFNDSYDTDSSSDYDYFN